MNKSLELKRDATLPNGLTFKKGEGFEIVMGVVYMYGYPIVGSVKTTITNWINNNPSLFNDVSNQHR